ncbi:MAG TPA: META domain-containing protein [Burkholderiales bacterium]|jgi:para-nitrobenzyl esterase
MRGLLAALLLLVVGCAQVAPGSSDLAGTSWRLVKFQGGDGKTEFPVDRSQYTFAFNTDGSFTARIDCNRGRGSWKSSGPGQLELGPMAMTRALCAPGSMHDNVVRQMPNIRSYVIRDRHLFISLMADGGTYELEPLK